MSNQQSASPNPTSHRVFSKTAPQPKAFKILSDTRFFSKLGFPHLAFCRAAGNNGLVAAILFSRQVQANLVAPFRQFLLKSPGIVPAQDKVASTGMRSRETQMKSLAGLGKISETIEKDSLQHGANHHRGYPVRKNPIVRVLIQGPTDFRRRA